MVAAVAGGASALSAGAQLFGASQQAGAAQAGQNVELSMFNKLQQLLSPFTQAGQSALPSLQALLGLGPQGGAGITSTLENLPGFQFALNQGLKSTQQSFEGRGLGLSGAAIKGADQYASGLASGNYNNFLSQLQGLAGLGENAAAGTGAGALSTGQGLAGLLQQGGTALAAGATGAANSLGSGAFNSTLFSSPLVNQLFGGNTQSTAGNLISSGDNLSTPGFVNNQVPNG